MKIVTATVAIAVACTPLLRVKFEITSPRKNRSLPQSKEVIPSLFVADDTSVFEPHDSASHAVDDGLVVGGDDNRRPFQIDAQEQLHDFARRRRIEISGR